MHDNHVAQSILNDNRDLLRFTTAGSVDDGKSTLIGRLLFDSKAIFQDQMASLQRASRLRGEEYVNLALLTDGLRAEREQGITIDVAYRYFSTPKRKFIIADTPGHEQYTRNMVTGASTADLAIILVDARNGVLTQSKRHGFLASLLGISHLLVAVNKMDLVDYDENVFQRIADDYILFSQKLKIHDITFIPVSALLGDNIVDHSSNMKWYDGPTVLHYLETVTIAADKNRTDFRFPVQYVIRPHQDFRGFAGRISSGSIACGQEIALLPSGILSKVAEIHSPDGPVNEAFVGQSVIISLVDEIDISRGDMIVRSHNIPTISRKIDAMICWMDEKYSMKKDTMYFLRHTTQEVQSFIRSLEYRVDVNTLHRDDGETLNLNEIGRIRLETSKPLFFDSYDNNRETGGFILIDPMTNKTVAAGMIRGECKEIPNVKPDRNQIKSENVFWYEGLITRELRETTNNHKAHCYWFTGLSGSGKSTLARSFEKNLFESGKQVFVIDGDNVRHGLNDDLGFSSEDRDENIRRVAHVARLFYDAGFIVICCFISPLQNMRDFARGLFPENSFSEVYVKCSLDECIKRDPKGLYGKAVSGVIRSFTGISAPYEPPVKPEIVIDTVECGIPQGLATLLEYYKKTSGI